MIPAAQAILRANPGGIGFLSLPRIPARQESTGS
jgi:hypothetical protein